MTTFTGNPDTDKSAARQMLINANGMMQVSANPKNGGLTVYNAFRALALAGEVTMTYAQTIKGHKWYTVRFC